MSVTSNPKPQIVVLCVLYNRPNAAFDIFAYVLNFCLPISFQDFLNPLYFTLVSSTWLYFSIDACTDPNISCDSGSAFGMDGGVAVMNRFHNLGPRPFYMKH